MFPLRGEFKCNNQFNYCLTLNFLTHHLSSPIQVIMAQTTKRADFEAVFPKLAEEILGHAKKYNLPDNALAWFEKVRLDAYKHFGPKSHIS